MHVQRAWACCWRLWQWNTTRHLFMHMCTFLTLHDALALRDTVWQVEYREGVRPGPRGEMVLCKRPKARAG